MKRFLIVLLLICAASAQAQLSTTYIDFPKARRVCQEVLQNAVEQIGRNAVRNSSQTRFGRSNTFFGRNSNEPAYRLITTSPDGINLTMELQVSVRYIPPVAVYFPEAYEVSRSSSINGQPIEAYLYSQWQEQNLEVFDKGLQILLRDAPDCNAGSSSSSGSSSTAAARIPFHFVPKITFPPNTRVASASNAACLQTLTPVWADAKTLLSSSEQFTRQGGCYYLSIKPAEVLASLSDLLPKQGLTLTKTLKNTNGTFQTWYAANATKGILLWYANSTETQTALIWFEVERSPSPSSSATSSSAAPSSSFAFEPKLAVPSGTQSYPSTSCQTFIDELTKLYPLREGDKLVSSGCYLLASPVARASQTLNSALQNLGWQNYWRGQSQAGYEQLGFFDGQNPAMILQFIPATDPNYSFVVWVRFERS